MSQVLGNTSGRERCRMIQQGVRVGTKRTFLQESRRFKLMRTALGVGRGRRRMWSSDWKVRSCDSKQFCHISQTELSSLQMSICWTSELDLTIDIFQWQNHYKGFFFSLLIYFWLCWAFSSFSEQGLLSSCGAQASHCDGFSCCSRALAQYLWQLDFVVPWHLGSS